MDPVTWHVVGDQITQSTTLARGGTGIKDVYVIPYVIDSGPARGHGGSVQVDAASFTPQTVKEAIDAQVNAVHSIAGLTS